MKGKVAAILVVQIIQVIFVQSAFCAALSENAAESAMKEFSTKIASLRSSGSRDEQNSREAQGCLKRVRHIVEQVDDAKTLDQPADLNKSISSNQRMKIGEAWVESDGTIIIQINSMINSKPFLKYDRDNFRYSEVLKHVGGLKLGEVKSVYSWSE